MSTHYYTKHKEKIKLSEKPFASGGEGSLFKIISPQAYKNSVAKLYHPQKRSNTRHEKINYLLTNPPILSQTGTSTWHPTLVWPQDIIYDPKGNFAGLVMPLVKGQKLEVLCSNKLPKRLLQTEWSRFSFRQNDALNTRIKLCYNIAAAIHDIHSTGAYILIDLKPDNIIVRPDGVVSLVDMDSVEVVRNGQILYEAPVATPEYTPPENYLKNLAYSPTQDEAWDRFSMAVIFYKLLLGIHPFAASCYPPFDKASSLHHKIEHGLFVHDPSKQDLFLAIPQPHQKFSDLEKGIQELFLRCFVAGHQNPQLRPSAEEWCYVLSTGHILGGDFPPPSSKFFVPTAIPDLLPNQATFEAEELFKTPTFQLLSTDAEAQIKTVPRQLTTVALSAAEQEELKYSRFLNMLFLIFLIAATTALSIVSPIILSILIGLIVYLSLNYRSYQNRNFRGRRQLLKTTLAGQKERFDQVLGAVKTIETRADKLLYYIQKAQKRFSPSQLTQAQQYQQDANQAIASFKVYINRQDAKTKAIENKERAALQQLHQEYQQKIKADPTLQKIAGITAEQKLQQVRLLKKASTGVDDKIYYTTLEEQLVALETAFGTRKEMIEQQYYQEYQKILLESETAYSKVQNALALYQNAVPEKQKKAIQGFFQQQGPRLRQLTSLKTQLQELEPQVNNSLKDYHRIKIEMNRYEDLSFGSHLLQMLFLKK